MYFVQSSDRSAVCGPTIEVTVRADDASAFEPQKVGKQQLHAAQAYVQYIFCKRSFDRTTIKFSMIAGDQVVRRVTIDSEDGFLREEFVNPGDLRNPSGEKLDTSNLRLQTFIDHIFYGRFDRMRAEDPGRGMFSWLYYEFISQYGARYKEYLKRPLKEYTVTVDITRNGVTTRSSSTYTMEARIYDSFRRNEQYRSGIFGTHHKDIEAILQRHAPRGPAMIQLYENFYRYASDLPPIQDAPEQAAPPGKQPEPLPTTSKLPRSTLSMAVERYFKSRLSFSIPDDALAKKADFIASRFEKIPLPAEDRQGWTSGTGEQEVFNLGRVSAFHYSREVARPTREALGRFMDEIVAYDPLLIEATCAFCDRPERPERPAGFAARFLNARQSGPGALSNETLIDPLRFEGLRYVDFAIRDKWRKELPKSLPGRILRCEYLPTTGSMRSRPLRVYWYHATPTGWDQVSTSLSGNHPLLVDVKPPQNSCPDRLSVD